MRAIFALAAWLLSLPAFAAGLQLESGVRPVTFIELYTSEGCNSCPPAEAHLNAYRNSPELWTRIIPLAFHVDYWDYLGWKDRFSKREYSERQQRYARARRVNTIYTPAFFVNGRNWRPGLFGGEPQAEQAAVGKFTVTLHDNVISAVFVPAGADPGPLRMHVAILGMDLVSEIRAGENAGRRAQHEFVVLAEHTIAGSDHRWRGMLPHVESGTAPRYGLAAWLSRDGDPAPLQAVGGYLPEPMRGIR